MAGWGGVGCSHSFAFVTNVVATWRMGWGRSFALVTNVVEKGTHTGCITPQESVYARRHSKKESGTLCCARLQTSGSASTYVLT